MINATERGPETATDVDTLWVHYALPLTKLIVDASIEDSLDSTPGGGEDEASTTTVVSTAKVLVTTSVTADPLTAYRLIVTDQGLAKKTVTLTLDKNRMITGLNTAVSRDVTPILKGIATLIPMVTPVLGFDRVKPKPLEEQWPEQFPRLSGIHGQLSAQLTGLLAQLANGSDAAGIVALGNALAVVKSELSAIDAVRRDWMAAHATIRAKKQFTLRAADLYLLPRSARTRTGDFPQVLPQDFTISGPLQELAQDYRTLIVLFDPERAELVTDPDGNIPPAPHTTTDHILIRSPRLATFALYSRTSAEEDWILDPASVQNVTLVDELSALLSLQLTAQWLRERKLEIGMESDHSIKSYGITRDSALGGIVTSATELVSSGKDFFKSEPEKTADEQAVAQAKAKIELLKTSSQLSRLANRYGLRDEIELAERLVRMADK
jgi:hypothetical protein